MVSKNEQLPEDGQVRLKHVATDVIYILDWRDCEQF
jgi:hypothetical protein